MSKTNINGEEISVITSDIEGAKYSSSPITANLINESIPSWQNVLETTGGNPSNDIAFVSDTGSDVIGEFEIGNPLKPFATIQAAITAIGSNGTIKALGGTYTEASIAINASNIFLDISNCTINSRIVLVSGSNNIIYAEGAIINANNIGSLIFQGSDTRVFGGTWNGGAFSGLVMQSAGGGYFEGCTFTSTGTDAANGYSSTFINCYFDCSIVSLGSAGLKIFGFNLLTTVKGGNITSSSSYGILVDGSEADIQGVQLISGNTGIAISTGTNKIKIKNSKLKGVTQEAFRMNGNCEEVYIQGCELYGFTDCITYFVNVNRLNNEVNIFNNCYLLCGTGQIFTESYLGTDTGSAIASYCFINKALPVLTKITDNFTTLDTGLQEF